MNDLPQTEPVNEALLFQGLRWLMLRNTLRVVMSRSLARVASILFCSFLIWATLFAVSRLGFSELKNRWHVPIDGQLVGFLFDVLFMSLTVLLIFSTSIILYSSLFSSAESAFLLVSPLSADQIFAYKFQGAVAFSSWAFVILGSPILIAYGVVVNNGAPWYFFVLLPVFFVGFVLLPGSLGALLCLLLVNFLPRRRKQLLWSVGALVLGGLGWWVYSRILPPIQTLLTSVESVNQLMGEVSLLRSPFLPAHWIGHGLQAAALDEPVDMLYYLALVWGNGLFLYVLTAWVARDPEPIIARRGRGWRLVLWRPWAVRSLGLYRRGFNRMASGGSLRRRYGGAWMDNSLTWLLKFLDPQTRLLIIKDFRTFRRDPAQWAQILIFLGLAVLYFSNVRSFYQKDLGQRFQNGISLLNLTATSFLMCAYTGRFIYPMLSLEGRKFWILGLLPLERERLLWGKFAFSATGSLLVAEFLVIFSNLMLSMPWPIIALHALIVAVLAFGLSGLSVGLGACMPNFRETDPSKIAVGFGGTINLVACLLLLLLVIGFMALPSHLAVAARKDYGTIPPATQAWLVFGIVVGLVLGTLTVFVPLRAGKKALGQMEF